MYLYILNAICTIVKSFYTYYITFYSYCFASLFCLLHCISTTLHQYLLIAENNIFCCLVVPLILFQEYLAVIMHTPFDKKHMNQVSTCPL